MDTDFLNNLSLNLDSLNSLKLPGFLNELTSPSPDMLSSLSSISLNQMLLIMGGLMLFRFFGGMVFSVVRLAGLALSTVTSVVCAMFSCAIRIFGSTAVSFIELLGSIGSMILSTPMKVIRAMLCRWGRFMIPVVASGVMSSLYLQGDSLTNWLTKTAGDRFSNSGAWVAIENTSSSDSLEKF